MDRFGNKQPYEEYYIKFDFSEDMSDGDTIATISSVTAIDVADNSDVSASMLDSNLDFSEGAEASIFLKGGTTDHTYKITCKILTTTLGEKYELEGLLTVKEI